MPTGPNVGAPRRPHYWRRCLSLRNGRLQCRGRYPVAQRSLGGERFLSTGDWEGPAKFPRHVHGLG